MAKGQQEACWDQELEQVVRHFLAPARNKSAGDKRSTVVGVEN